MRSHLPTSNALDQSDLDQADAWFLVAGAGRSMQPSASAPLSASVPLTGSTVAGGTKATTASTTSSPTSTQAVMAAPAISLAARSVLAGMSQSVAFSSLFTVGSSTANPAYLIVSGLDRNEYTAGFQTSSMGHLAGGGATQGFTNFGGDGYSVGVVFTYQPSTGQYVNASFGNLSQLAFDTGGRGDMATISVFGTNSASMATAYASNPLILGLNPAYFTDYGSVAVVTGLLPSTAPASATPNGIVSAAISYVGAAWNDNGCWVLASDISAKAGATLPLTSTVVGVSAIGNGEWFVAYNGPVSSNSNWQSSLVAGEMVSFQTTSGGGHITTVVAGQGASSLLIDNITYVDSAGDILNSANDGSAADVIVELPHAASQEFTGVNPATVVVYELDTPIVTAKAPSVTAGLGSTVSLAAAFTAADPKPGQSVTQYQVYETNAADTLMVAGVAQKAATSAATACTLSSLAGLSLACGATGSDTIEVRASNGSYWGDWTALGVSVTAPVTAAAASASGNTPFVVSDTAANIGAAADKLQALASAGLLTGVTVTGGGAVKLTAAQLANDHALLSLLPATGAVQVTGASVAQAAALQANAQVASFTITDTAANVGGQAGLGADTKLAKMTISGTASADRVDLTGVQAPAVVDLAGNKATAVGGFTAPLVMFSDLLDRVILGSGPGLIKAGVSGTSGVTAISNFQFGLDILQLTLGSVASLKAVDTSFGGVHAIALTGGNLTEGVVLLHQPNSVTAASIMASHISTSNGVAVVS